MLQERRLKIAIVAAMSEDPNQPRGGVEAVAVNLLRGLEQLGQLEIHVITTHRKCRWLSTKKWREITIHRLPWAGGSTLLHAVLIGRRQIQRYLATLSPDVVHAHDTFGLMVNGMSIPHVLTVHGFIYADTRLSRQRWAQIRWRIWRRVETAGWAEQPHIISINPYVRQELEKIATGIIHDIENPVDPSFFTLRRQDQGNRVLFAGAIKPSKNPRALLEAIRVGIALPLHEAVKVGRREKRILRVGRLCHR